MAVCPSVKVRCCFGGSVLVTGPDRCLTVDSPELAYVRLLIHTRTHKLIHTRTHKLIHTQDTCEMTQEVTFCLLA